MSENVKSRNIKWVYEVIHHRTGEIIKVISRKYIDEFRDSIRNYYCVEWLGGFGYDNVYYER